MTKEKALYNNGQFHTYTTDGFLECRRHGGGGGGGGGSLNWNSEGMGGGGGGDSEGMGGFQIWDFQRGQRRVCSLKTLILWILLVRK